MSRVLISPADYSISDTNYGKTYNLLDNLTTGGFEIETYVNECETPLANDVTVHELERGSKIGYYSTAFHRATKDLRAGQVDVYHHMNLSYRWFNPVLLAGLHEDTPVVIGPCQAGHDIMKREFNQLVSSAIGRELARSVTDPTYEIVDAVRNGVLDPIREGLFGATLEKADKIVAVHDEAKQKLANFVDSSKIEIVPLGVSPDDFEFRERPDSTSLVTVGNLRRRKGFDILLDAMSAVGDEYPDVHLHIFGEGPQGEALRRQARRLEIENLVTFHGYVEQDVLKRYLGEARAFVHPSRSESFSLVRLEAMASGCPVVVSDIDGAWEMVRDGTDGFVVPTESPGKLAESIMDILGDIELARAMGRSARERVEAKYDWEIIGRQYGDVYRSVV